MMVSSSSSSSRLLLRRLPLAALLISLIQKFRRREEERGGELTQKMRRAGPLHLARQPDARHHRDQQGDAGRGVGARGLPDAAARDGARPGWSQCASRRAVASALLPPRRSARALLQEAAADQARAPHVRQAPRRPHCRQGLSRQGRLEEPCGKAVPSPRRVRRWLPRDCPAPCASGGQALGLAV